MHFIGLSIVVQLLCAVHCVRNGRNGLWLMVILFLSIPGCLAYAFFEILPQYAGRREVRTMKSAAARVIDPERELRESRRAIELADTAANRIRLADALADQCRWKEAILHYELAIARTPAKDRALQFRLAMAEFEAGRSARARELLESLPATGSQAEMDRANLLLARALEEVDAARALEIYADVGRRMPGGEAQCRQAALLLSLGRGAEALPALIEVERRAGLMDRFERAKNSEMYEWAANSLAELRLNQVGG
jgi:hypothetical protein